MSSGHIILLLKGLWIGILHKQQLTDAALQVREGEDAFPPEEAEDSLLDLISGYGQQAEAKGDAKGTRQEAPKAAGGKGTAKVLKSRVP